MNIIVWGCRGSITTPGTTTIKYGGESTCVEVRSNDGQVIIIDAGSGIRKLGHKLLNDDSVKHLNLLLTHSHWDHLTGFPFFKPAYFSKFSVSLSGGSEATLSVKSYLMHEMDPPYFPVSFSELKATFKTACCCCNGGCDNLLHDAERSMQCDSIPLNHPNGGYGFKLTDKAGSFVFLTDTELRFDHIGGFDRGKYLDFCKNADLLFHDAQYLESEYNITRGWGHSTYRDAVDFALEAGVKRLGLVHHDPDRTDDEIDQQVELCRTYIKGQSSSLECFACAEGMELAV
jgi:phosphoribosyl 1,2-cyclic phosphodiesterase